MAIWGLQSEVPSQNREDPFMSGKGSGEGYSKQRALGFSLAESLPGKKRSLSSSYWALLLLQGMTVSPLVSQLYLSEVSLNFFYCENGNKVPVLTKHRIM